MIALLWGEEGEGGNDPQVSDLSAVAARRPGHLYREGVWMYLSTSEHGGVGDITVQEGLG